MLTVVRQESSQTHTRHDVYHVADHFSIRVMKKLHESLLSSFDFWFESYKQIAQSAYCTRCKNRRK
jgi:hypothetical protein